MRTALALAVSVFILIQSVLFLVVMATFRNRIRRLWKELLSFHMEIQTLRKEVTSVRKQGVIAQTEGQLKLPALLPSEDGEEIILYNFFGRKRDGFYVEVGAYNGVDLSNTYFFEALGWHGILIEPDPVLYKQCLHSRPGSKVLNVAASNQPGILYFTTAVGKEWLSFSGENKERELRVLAEGGSLARKEVPCLTLDDILADHSGPIDFISIDVEGFELSVLNGLDFNRFAPRVFVVEQNRSEKTNDVNTLLNKHGYSCTFCLGSNSFYVREGEEAHFGW